MLEIIEITPLLHLVNARFGDFYAGLFHVVTAIEHLLPILALGLFAGQQDTKGARSCLIAFSSFLLVGVMVGTKLPEIEIITFLSIFSLIIMGGIVTIHLKASIVWLIIIAGVLGLIQGVANGSALGNGIQVLNFSTGVLVTGIAIVTLFSGLALSMVKYWQKMAIRVVGSWIVAMGIIYLPFLIMNIK
jgi:urease accessory protein